MTNEQGTLSVLSYFIQKNRNIYVFHGFAEASSFPNYTGTFKRTMEGFDRLKNQAAKKVQPARIKLVTVTRATNLETFLKKYPSKKADSGKLAIINGMELNDRLKRGYLIKVLTK